MFLVLRNNLWTFLVICIPFRIKEKLRKTFADLANDFEQRLRSISSELTTIEGTLEVLFLNLFQSQLH